MNLRIKGIEKGNGKDFTEFFSNLNFDHASHWAGCYCRFYHTDCTQDEWQNRSGEKNQREAEEKIDSGEMKGYLAYDNDKVIGWLNGNDAASYIRLKEQMRPVIQDKKAACTICYVIHPDYRRKGVASALLDYALEDFKSRGYDGVLAIPLVRPNNEADSPASLYRGAVSMYSKKGFRELFREGPLRVMWLDF